MKTPWDERLQAIFKGMGETAELVQQRMEDLGADPQYQEMVNHVRLMLLVLAQKKSGL